MGAKRTAIIKYSMAAAVILTASGARVLGLTPFGAGLFFSFVAVGLNPLILAPAYIGSSLLFSPTLNTLLGTGIASIIFTGIWLLKKIKKTARLLNSDKNFPQYLWFLLSPLALCGFLPMVKSEAVAVVLFVFLVPITMYIGCVFFSPLLRRGLRFKLLDNELICGGIILCVLTLGLCRADILYFPTVAVFAAFMMLLFGKIYGPIGSLTVGICFGIGSAVYDYQIIWLAYYPVMALLCAIFLPTPRIIGAISNLIGYTLITYFFDINAPYAYLWLAALFLGGLLYAAIPKKTLNRLKNLLNPPYSPAGARFNINLLREEAARSIYRTGEVFDEMSFYIAGGGSDGFSANKLIGRVRDEVCRGCKKKCAVKDADIESLISVSVEKGRATVIDLPQTVLDSCTAAAAMITSAASIAGEYHKRLEKQRGEGLAKDIVGEQLHGVGEVLKAMSGKLKTPVSYDFDKENKIKEEFIYRGIYCHDAVISPDSITLIIAEEHYDKDAVERILKKVTKRCYTVVREDAGGTGLAVYAQALPAFDVVFAAAGLAKGEISGDTHSFIKIDGGKFLMALCDGMGSGQAAERFSAGTIALIECFYKAGFDHGMVIKSVNRFLSLSSEETFAASDICVVDLNNGLTDIFKISSPACFIKTAETVKTIEGSSLPMGMLDDIRPSFCEAALNDGDMLVLVSDGISDCFEGDALAAEISCASDVSPQDLVKQVLNKAKNKCKKVRDDMTVAAFRLFLNV